jgi:hypothetical protein
LSIRELKGREGSSVFGIEERSIKRRNNIEFIGEEKNL